MSAARDRESEVGSPHGHGSRQPVARDGIALIVVLGMLALMVLMGVTFSIYMRTERVAAGNFRNDVCVRQLLHVALNRAIQDIEASTPISLKYPPWDILLSDSGSVSVSNVMVPSTIAWIPGAALGTNVNPDVKWIDVQTGAGANGRVGYLVVNCSGLLDANYAGGLPVSDRLCGTNPAAIQIDALPEVAPGGQTKIKPDRDYETVQELGIVGTQNGTFSRSPSNFVTFSAFPTGSLVDISSTVADLLMNGSNIVAAFTNSGFGSSQAGILFTNLIDYVDIDSIPGNLGDPAAAGIPNGPFVEPIWFCNEVSFSNRIDYAYDGTNTVWTNRIWVQYEWFFPFKGTPDTRNFKAEFKVLCEGPPVFATTPSPYVMPFNIPANANVQQFFAPGPVLLMSPNGGRGAKAGAFPATTSVVATVIASVFKDNVVVDIVTNVLTITNTFNLSLGLHTTTGWDGRECKDPRLNHRPNVWERPSSSSMKAMNSNVQRLWTPPPPAPSTALDFADGDLDMFVRNDRLQSVGELGYLFFGVEGQTVRLYKHGTKLIGSAHSVLDNFTTSGGGTGRQKGRVNLNTPNADVLACVFNEAPIDYPHGSKTKRVTDPLLGNIVRAILTQGSSFTNLSELGRAGIDWKALYPTGSDQDRESLIRNSVGLLHTRQNLFTILLFAQMTRDVAGLSEKSVVAEVRAIAEVWRDPVVDAYFVRTFKILNE